ncbi:MAG: endopeptidase La [Armatimonadetes bacterium]|nr:endopeptidase La [Armatimonadota bacterium]
MDKKTQKLRPATKRTGQSQKEKTDTSAITIPDTLSLLPLTKTVVFPLVVAPLTITAESSVQLVDDAVVTGQRVIGLALARNPDQEKPGFDELHSIGVAAVIHTMLRMPDGQRMIVQGLQRVRLLDVVQTEPYLRVQIEKVADIVDYNTSDTVEVEALRRNLADLFKRIVEMSQNIPDELLQITRIEQPGLLADTIAAHLPVSAGERQSILEILGIRERMTALLRILTREVEVLELGNKIASDVSSEMGKTQREYYLREQLKAIQRELGMGDKHTEEVDELRKAVEEAHMPEEAAKQAERELERLSRMPAAAPEYGVSRNYVDWLVAMPWDKATRDNLDIKEVRKVLDSDHYGLDKVKDRILEYLSVRKFKPEGHAREPILCLFGPPGVGKTSLGMSIARSLGKKFVRISLGGVHDEAELRGHRRTYIGALPGQIVQGIRRAGTNNPLFMLDEVDKVGRDFRGDPSSALLEILDPEQNSTFRDHYLEVPFDLSRVLFVTTANQLDTIAPPLRDRMEIIEIAGYTEEEKIQIALTHLIPKQMKEHGLTKKHVRWNAPAIKKIIAGYTREAGVRNLERQIAKVCRKITRAFAEGREETVTVNSRTLQDYLGAPRFPERELVERTTAPGIATGLAYTPVGGDVLFIEATLMPGSKQLVLTGQLGDVMKESAQAALSYVRSHARDLRIDPDFFRNSDIHLHVPAGAIPKDGPSAGVVMTTALASLLTGRKIKPRVAMTGEITLRGKVMPVGGIKEKVLAAHRAGVKMVILPEQNRKDVLEDVPEDVQKDIEFAYVKDISQALGIALEEPRNGHRATGKRTAVENESSTQVTT